MLPGIVEIQENGCHLSKQNGFLTVELGHELRGQVPLDDIAVLMVSAHGASFSKEALVSLAQHGATSVLCGRNALPEALVLPYRGNYEAALRLRAQMEASKPLQKRLWQAIVKAKLTNQALLLEHSHKHAEARTILDYRRDVDSGDPKNREASGARVYWKALMGDDFIRKRDGAWPNAALNYGYAILRACVARAITAVGLLPYLGVHHHNDTNAFPLADDIMEPGRPLVDAYVAE